MKILTIAIIVLVSLTINKIGFDSGTSEKTSVRMDAPLVGTQWTLVELSNTKIPTNAMSNGIFFILRKDSTVSGKWRL